MHRRLATLIIVIGGLLQSSPGVAATTTDFSPSGYFVARPDMRDCVSPLCGGYFVKRVNSKQTRCSDGTLKAECYVAAVRNAPSSGLGGETPIVLQGRIKSRVFGDFGELGVFVIHGAWHAATATPGNGRFAGMQNNGIVCITSPCFSYDQYVLNKSITRSVSEIELSGVGAPADREDAALQIIATGGVLIATGVNVQVNDVAGTGLKFVADQFYLPIP